MKYRYLKMDLQENLENKYGGEHAVDTSIIEVDRVVAIKCRGKSKKVKLRRSKK